MIPKVFNFFLNICKSISYHRLHRSQENVIADITHFFYIYFQAFPTYSSDRFNVKYPVSHGIKLLTYDIMHFRLIDVFCHSRNWDFGK